MNKNENEGKFNFDRAGNGSRNPAAAGQPGEPREPGEHGENGEHSQVSLKRAAIFTGLLLGVVALVLFLTISLLPKTRVEAVTPTMEDSKIQGEKLRAQRQQDERNLGEMRDRLIEEPTSQKQTFARDMMNEFERMYEEAKREQEEQANPANKESEFAQNLEKYESFDAEKYMPEETPRTRLEKEERQSMVVVDAPGEEKEPTANPGSSQEDGLEQRLDRVITTLEDQAALLQDNDSQVTDTANTRKQRTRQVTSSLSKKENQSVTLSYNSDYPMVILYEGEYLEGVLTTEISSDIQEGPVMVRTSRDFYDDSGVYVVIPYGTKVLGRTQVIDYKGQKRLYIWFERIILPTRKSGEPPASIHLPARAIALDRQGTAGLVSKVNRHFWLQYGSALLFGVLDGLTGVAQGAASSGSGKNPASVVIDSTGQNISRVNEFRYREYENIMPTVTVRPGAKVKVYMACDIHISAYDLKENRPYAAAKDSQHLQER